MKKTSVLLSAAAIALCTSSVGLGLSDFNFGPQMGSSTIQNYNSAEGHVINAYGFVVNANLTDMFSTGLDYVNAGTYISGIANVYYNHHLTDKLTTRIGLGFGIYHQYDNATDVNGKTTEGAYQGTLETEYRIADSIGFSTSYHYLHYNNIPSSTHIDQFLIGVNYYLN